MDFIYIFKIWSHFGDVHIFLHFDLYLSINVTMATLKDLGFLNLLRVRQLKHVHEFSQNSQYVLTIIGSTYLYVLDIFL